MRNVNIAGRPSRLDFDALDRLQTRLGVDSLSDLMPMLVKLSAKSVQTIALELTGLTAEELAEFPPLRIATEVAACITAAMTDGEGVDENPQTPPGATDAG